ncbi:serine/threonine kinase, partial [Candidatus Thiomargarita nelsonii]
LERDRASSSPSYGGNKALLIGIVVGSVFSLLLGLIFLTPLLIQEKSVEPSNLTPLVSVTKQPTDKPVIKNEAEAKFMPKLKPLRRYRDQLKQGGKGPLMLKLPGGTFKMGSANSLPYHDERPQHEVTLQSFSMSRYEITFEEYDPFAKATGHSLPDDRGWGREKRPVINVN